MDRRDMNRIAAEVGCTERTVRNWAAGQQMSRTTEYALEQACKKLGIEIPAERCAAS